MTLDKARELLANHIAIGGGYNRNAARLVLAEIQRTQGQDAVDQLIVEMDLATAFGFKTGRVYRY